METGVSTKNRWTQQPENANLQNISNGYYVMVLSIKTWKYVFIIIIIISDSLSRFKSASCCRIWQSFGNVWLCWGLDLLTKISAVSSIESVPTGGLPCVFKFCINYNGFNVSFSSKDFGAISWLSVCSIVVSPMSLLRSPHTLTIAGHSPPGAGRLCMKLHDTRYAYK